MRSTALYGAYYLVLDEAAVQLVSANVASKTLGVPLGVLVREDTT